MATCDRCGIIIIKNNLGRIDMSSMGDDKYICKKCLKGTPYKPGIYDEGMSVDWDRYPEVKKYPYGVEWLDEDDLSKKL